MLVSKTSGDTKTVVGTYSFPAPGGAWASADNCSYDLALSDAAGRDVARLLVDAVTLPVAAAYRRR